MTEKIATFIEERAAMQYQIEDEPDYAGPRGIGQYLRSLARDVREKFTPGTDIPASKTERAYVQAFKAESARAEAAEKERDENEGAFKVWRRRCEEADRRIAELEKQLLAAMTASGQCTEEHIWPGHPKYDAMVEDWAKEHARATAAMAERDSLVEKLAAARLEIERLCRLAASHAAEHQAEYDEIARDLIAAQAERDRLAREIEAAETHRAQSKIRAKEAERERDEVIAKFNRMQEAHVNLNRDLYEQRAQRDRRIAELEAALRGLFDASDHVLGVQWRATTLNVADGDELNRAWDDANAALSAPASPAPAVCATCNGMGMRDIRHSDAWCTDCDGDGVIPSPATATKLVHFARVPFQAVCGADVPNQSTTASRGVVTCAACVEATVASDHLDSHSKESK